MKKVFKRKYLPDNYKQDVYLRIHSFRQNDMNVEENTAKFDNLMIKGELVEFDEHTIARYLGRLKYEISNVVALQFYCSLKDVMKLALKVEKQIKEKKSNTNRLE